MTILYIAEKPSVAQDIANALPGAKTKGDGFISIDGGKTKVSWCLGHILETKQPDEIDPKWKGGWNFGSLPITPYPLPLKPTTRGKGQLAVLKRLCAEATLIVNAGDADREGELLVREVLDYLKVKVPTKRIWILDNTKAGLQAAIAKMEAGSKYDTLYQSALGRQAMDFWVGMSLTRAMSLAAEGTAAGGGVTSVGRVQTPTMCLVVRRDLEIANFKPKDFFSVEGEFTAKGGKFKAKWEPGDNVPTDDEGRVLDKAVAQRAATLTSDKAAEVVAYESVRKKEQAPLPFDLPELQKAANNKFGFTAAKTLELAQALYEKHKLLTYPRSESRYLPENLRPKVASTLAAIAGNLPALGKLIGKASPSAKHAAFDDSKVGSHYGIVPTEQSKPANSLSPDEQKILELVYRSYVALFFPAYEFQSVKVSIECQGEAFKASGNTPMVQGWKEVYGQDADDEDKDSPKIPALSQGEALWCDKASVIAKQTKPPAPFTEATLLEAMKNIHLHVTDERIKEIFKRKLKDKGETSGLGTPATRAAIIERIIQVGYVRRKGKKLESTPKAQAVFKMLPAQLRDPDLTALFEEELKKVKDGETQLDKVLESTKAFVEKQVELAKNLDAGSAGAYKCTGCSTGRLVRIARKDKTGHFWGCTRFRDGCKTILKDANGKPELPGAAAPAAKGGAR